MGSVSGLPSTTASMSGSRAGNATPDGIEVSVGNVETVGVAVGIKVSVGDVETVGIADGIKVSVGEVESLGKSVGELVRLIKKDGADDTGGSFETLPLESFDGVVGEIVNATSIA